MNDFEKSFNENDDSNFKTILDLIEKSVGKLPDFLLKTIKEEIKKIQNLTLDSRSPRIMIVGRCKAGKSSLLNAIFGKNIAETSAVISKTGKPKWYTFESIKGQIDILDTRGFGDLTQPDSAEFNNSVDEIKNELNKKHPDAILFLCKASDVDSNFEHDISKLKQIISHTKERTGYTPPIIGVATQVDTLYPLRNSEPPFNEEKMQNIETSVNAFERALKDTGVEFLKVIPVCAYTEYDRNNINNIIYTNYWNISSLVVYLIEQLPNEAKLKFARMTALKEAQEKISRILIHSASTISAGIAWVPIPLADIIPLTALQIALIINIGYVSGRELTKKNAMEFLAAIGVNVGAAMGLREIARGIMKWVLPGLGSAVSSAIAYAGTWAIGEAALEYFIKGNKDFKYLNNLWENVSKAKRKEKEKEME